MWANDPEFFARRTEAVRISEHHKRSSSERMTALNADPVVRAKITAINGSQERRKAESERMTARNDARRGGSMPPGM